jgi:acyl-ACP thioesterase
LLYIRDFRILNHKEEHLGSVTSSWLIIDTAKRRPSSFKPLDQMLDGLSDRHAIRTSAAKLPALQSPWETFESKVYPSDIDVNGHVNNTRYIRWACDHLGTPMNKPVQIREITLNFLSELHLDDVVEIHRQKFADDNSMLFSIVNKGLNTESARVSVSW